MLPLGRSGRTLRRTPTGDTARVRIAIDARPASDAEPTGVGHYTRRILAHLPAAMPSDELVAWHPRAEGSDLPRSPNLTETVSRIPAVLEPVWRRLEVPRLESQVRFDALLATNFLPPPTRSDGVVLVVHDLAFEVMPEAGPGFGERWRRRFDGWLRRSAAVIVPSSSARADLLERHRLDDGQVHVIPHGADAVRGAGARRGRTRPRAVRDRRAVRAVRRRDRAAEEPRRAGPGVRLVERDARRGS